jgi:hypothetical protein
LLSFDISQWIINTFGNSEFNTLFCAESEFAEMLVIVSFTIQAAISCFIQIYLVFVVTWLEDKNKHIGLHKIQQMT